MSSLPWWPVSWLLKSNNSLPAVLRRSHLDWGHLPFQWDLMPPHHIQKGLSFTPVKNRHAISFAVSDYGYSVLKMCFSFFQLFFPQPNEMILTLSLYFLLFIAFYLSLFITFVVWQCCEACRILVPWPGTEPMPAAVERWSSNHWTAREVPLFSSLTLIIRLLSSPFS